MYTVLLWTWTRLFTIDAKGSPPKCVQCMHILILNSPLALLIDKRSWQTQAHLVEEKFSQSTAGKALRVTSRAAETQHVCGLLHIHFYAGLRKAPGLLSAYCPVRRRQTVQYEDLLLWKTGVFFFSCCKNFRGKNFKRCGVRRRLFAVQILFLRFYLFVFCFFVVSFFVWMLHRPLLKVKTREW